MNHEDYKSYDDLPLMLSVKELGAALESLCGTECKAGISKIDTQKTMKKRIF